MLWHILAVIVIFLLLIGAYSLPSWRNKTLRLLDQWGGLLIIIFGLVVITCGCLGFAPHDQSVAAKQTDPSGEQQDAGKVDPPKIDSENAEEKESSPAQGASVDGALYETFQIFAFNIDRAKLVRSWWLRLAMIAAVLLATLVAAKGIAVLFRDSYEALALRFKKKHFVVCGLGRIGRQLLIDLKDRKLQFKIVVIEPDPENKHIAWARDMGAVVLIGDATRREMLEAARVQLASEVFVVTGSDECNIEAAIEIREIILEKGRKTRLKKQLGRLRCHVHVLDKDLAKIVRDKSLLLERISSHHGEQAEGENELIDVEVFNALERTARRLLEDIAKKILLPSSFDQTPDLPPKVLHYFMFGFGEFGQTLAIELAELSQFPFNTRPRMTLFDVEIEKKAGVFKSRNPTFCATEPDIRDWVFRTEGDRWDRKEYRPPAELQIQLEDPGVEYVCNARFVEYLDIADDAMLAKMKQICEAANIQPIILVCFEDDRENFARAERLRAKLDTLEFDWPIFVWIPRQRELSQLLKESRDQLIASGSPACQLIPFGQCYGSVSYDEITCSWVDWLARHLHLIWMKPCDDHWAEAIGELQAVIRGDACLNKLKTIDWEALDKTAKLIWEDRLEWERASNRSCAVHSVIKAAAMGLQITGFTTKPRFAKSEIPLSDQLSEQLRMMEHYRWVAERLLDGWRYDEERSNRRKKRWQIAPWCDLENPPPHEQELAAAEGKEINEKMKDDAIVKFLVICLRTGLLTSTPLK